MAKFRTILKWIVRRIKGHMDAVFLTMGGILIPLGFYLKIDYAQADNYGTVAVLLGLILWVLAYYMVKRKEGRERAEGRKRDLELEIERQEHTKLLVDIRDELRKLNRGGNGCNDRKP